MNNEDDITRVLERITNKDTDINIILMMAECAKEKDSKIHPIFRRWQDLSDEDFVRIGPALVLASYILESYHMTAFLSTILVSPRSKTAEKNVNPVYTAGIPLERISRARDSVTNGAGVLKLTAKEEEQVRDTLKEMTLFMTLQASAEPEARGGHAFTVSGTRLKIFGKNFGVRSSIVYNEGEIAELDPLIASKEDLVVGWFQMAQTLCHEICHTVHYFKYGLKEIEPIFEDQHFNEMGFAFEELLFGAHFSSMFTAPGYVLPMHAIRLADGGIMIAERPHWLDVRKDTQNVYIVHWTWLVKLFAHEFWDRTPRPENPNLLFPSMGYYATIKRGGDLTHVKLDEHAEPTLVRQAQPIGNQLLDIWNRGMQELATSERR